ncbi:MAG: helicase [Candidatus Lokiarchaeota archaeon]|nr:helicase [Candidatus Lokiarchaeota archaeon]
MDPTSLILDNRGNGTVIDALRENLSNDSVLHVVTRTLSLFGFQAIQEELENLEYAELLLSLPHMFPPEFEDFPPILGSPEDRPFRNKLTIQYLARQMDTWLQNSVGVKATEDPLNANYFEIGNRSTNSLAIHGSSTFTTHGLGILPSISHEMNTAYLDDANIERLHNWFEAIWNNDDRNQNVKSLLSKQLQDIYSPRSPQLLYFQTLYHLFKDSLHLIDEDHMLKTRTGIKNTVIWNKLYKFQQDGVIGAISKIEQHNGCIIADSVGLGKTYEALAIIKYYELRNDRVLVLTPKKLRENWTLYTLNDKRNLFLQDRFNYDVINHTDLTRDGGMSGDINLETINWGMYDLVVIDESHNFRNNPPKKDGATRYGALMNQIIKSGVKTKVLMLSATPVNNRMNDLKNQVAFITEGTDDALYDSGIHSIELTLRKAQAKFNQWQKLETNKRTSDQLLDSLNFDYFKLLDLLTIARSRKHITKYFNSANLGQFPERLKPLNVKPDIDIEDNFPPLREINREIRKLNLSAYSPLKYLLPEKREEYSRKYDTQVAQGSVFKQVDREESLIHLMRVNILKRLESSVISFTATLDKLLGKVQDLIERINTTTEIEELSIEDVDLEDESMEPFLIGSKIKVLIQDMDPIRWKDELKEDEQRLIKLLRIAKSVDAGNDAKLQQLKTLIYEKTRNPINENNNKVLIFTAFADTAEYLYKHLSRWASDELHLHSAIVTGTGGNRTTLSGLPRDLSSIITAFSPISKERDKLDVDDSEEIDILIATDCISEGQNLQDCDFVVNYDIHWNPVRIIQRFGRIDRLGSINERIQLVNFWPNLELDEYINLEARVSGRMVLLDISATGEENIIEFEDAGKMNDLEYRRRQMERLHEEVIDLEDLGGGISITDLTLNDFRMDLSEFLKEHEETLMNLPIGGRAFVQPDEFVDSSVDGGVLFCLKAEQTDISIDPNYSIEPHYLVFIDNNGEVSIPFTQTKKLLDLFKQLSLGNIKPTNEAYQQFNTITNHGRDMSQYQDLLASAVQSITGKVEEKGIESLFTRGSTQVTATTFQGLDDFEVVSYLIVSPEDI